MKKRLTMFALIVGLIVAFGVPAWAEDAVAINVLNNGTYGTINQYRKCIRN